MLKSVFIVDDDNITIKICKLILQNSKFAENIIDFENGKPCINFFADYFGKQKSNKQLDELPQMIFLDLNMPVMNGWEFLDDFVRKYSERLPEIKIVILSTSVDPRDFMKAQQYDIVIDFLNKPLTKDLVEELKENENFKPYFS